MKRSRESRLSTIRERRWSPVALVWTLVVIPAFMSASQAHAFPTIRDNFNSTYPGSASADNASCQLCHGASTSNWNEYGWQLREANQDFAAVEALPSMNLGGGTTMLDEINASAQPGWTTGGNNNLYDSGGLISRTQTPPGGIGELDPAVTECGNGIVEANEACDDGNTADGDCCSANCQYDAAGSACDDGNFCTDGDACDGAGVCGPGGPRNCSDGVGCTADTCDPANATCVHTPDDSACADDGLFCNGEEICDAVNDCTSTGNPCDVGTVCNDASNTCDPETACGNGVVEPGEECDGGACCAADCTFAVAGSVCDDGDFCTSGDACDGAGTCQAVDPTDCSDGVGCTVDTCDSANSACVHTPDDGLCDNGTFCDGVEICDSANDCTSPGDPCSAGTLCDEATDACQPIAGCGDGILQTGEECDDGNTADGDCCSAGCQYEAAGSLCDDGQFCTAGEVCDGAGACGDGQPIDCGDGIACTDDACDEANATCVHTPNDTHCADDGLFCTGLEFCDPTNDCSSTGNPCDAGTTCNEDTATCDPAPVIVDLDIVRFKVAKRVRVEQTIHIDLVVRNGGESDGARPAMVVGAQDDGMEVYHETLDVADPPGDGATKVKFPPYTAAATGNITWTATIVDDDPDLDEATAMTRVVGPRGADGAQVAGNGDDHDDDQDDGDDDDQR